jgi:hypothetical protein
MSSTVVFWFAWFWKAFQTMPEFLGNNWVGAFFASICVFFYEANKFRDSKQSQETTTLRSKASALGVFLVAHWYATTKWWIFVLVMFYIGHTLDLVRQDSNSLTSQNTQLSTSVTTSNSTCTTEKDDLRVADATDKSKADTLTQQNRDQQNTINQCQEKALALLTPAARDVTVLSFANKQLGVGPDKERTWILLVNQIVTPIRLTVSCDSAFSQGFISVIGNNSSAANQAYTPDRNSFGAMLDTAWTPKSPLLVGIRYSSGIPDCGFRF